MYENSFLQSFGNDETKAKSYIDQVIAHMQTYYCHSSLGSQLEIRVTNFYQNQSNIVHNFLFHSLKRLLVIMDIFLRHGKHLPNTWIELNNSLATTKAQT